MQKIDYEIFTLLYQEGLSYEELASCFNCSITTVRCVKHKLRISKLVQCPDCKARHTVDKSNKQLCLRCSTLRDDSAVAKVSLRRMFRELIDSDLEKARLVAMEMQIVEGREFVKDVLGSMLVELEGETDGLRT